MINLAEEILAKIKNIDVIRAEIKSRAEEKAKTSAEYDKQLAITLIKLENDSQFELDGNIIVSPAKSIMDKIAKGICWQAKLEMDKADAMYKSVISNLDAVRSQLNGLQSINRNVESI